MIKLYKSINLETVAVSILLGVIFLLPLFVLPFGVFAVDFNKAIFLYIGVSVASIFFLLSRVRKGSIIFPKSFILLSLFLVALAWLASSLFSSNTALSLVGAGYETGTFAFFLFLAIIAYLVPVLFRRVEHLTLLYKVIFVSALILFVMQVLHTGFGIAVPPWGMFQDRLASVLGNWNDIGIFFGLVTLLSLAYIELGGENGKGRTFLWATLTTSLVAVFFVNFSTLQYVLGFLVLTLLVYRLANPPQFEGHSDGNDFSFLSPSFFVFLALVAFSVAHDLTGALVTFLGIQFTQVSPSWATTLDVVKGALSAHLFFGSGSNTFSYDWLMFKPSAISNTIFWDTRFSSGAGRIPSMIAETGIFGGTALVIFISSLLFAGKSLVSHKEHSLERMLLVSSFFGTVYLWTFTVIYSPGFLIFALAGIFTGVFVASLCFANKIEIAEVAFEKGTKKGFIMFFAVIGIIGIFVCSIYVFTSKYIAGYFYTQALKEVSVRNDVDKANKYLQKAVWLDPQDIYFRDVAEIELLRLGQLVARLSNTETVSDDEKTQFRKVLSATVQSAKNATYANPLEPENWKELGRVYETILQFDAKGFKSSAVFAYGEALRVSPSDPSPLLALARVELQTGNADEALKYLNESLKIKSDFVAGHLMLARVAVATGELKGAISELERAVFANPNNPENTFIVLQIGILYYQDGDYEKAQGIFERLVGISPNYTDARYALGILYDKKGLTSMATAQFEAIRALYPRNEEIQTILSNLRSGRDALGNVLAPPPAPEVPATKRSSKKK